MQTVQYTEAAKPESSAIDTVYFDDNTEQMFVRFHSGNVAGYRGVTRAVFNEFKNSNSVGKYYSSWIKGNYTGVNGDVNLVPAGVFSPADHVHKPTPAKLFSVEFTTSLAEKVNAHSVEDAVDRIKEDFGDDVNIKSVTQHFNS